MPVSVENANAVHTLVVFPTFTVYTKSTESPLGDQLKLKMSLVYWFAFGDCVVKMDVVCGAFIVVVDDCPFVCWLEVVAIVVVDTTVNVICPAGLPYCLCSEISFVQKKFYEHFF